MEENNENNDEEIRNVLNELINNEDETTQKILDKENKKMKIKKEKRKDIEPIIKNVKLYIVTITILLSVISKEEVGLAICTIGNMFIMTRAIAKIFEYIIICAKERKQRKRYIFLIILLIAECIANTVTIIWIVAYYKQELV